MWVKILTLALAMALFFTGCIAADEQSNPDTTLDPRAPTASFDEETGGISGLVRDPEIVPIPGAQVGLTGTDLVATSAQDGSFSFSNVVPGEYIIVAQRLGFSPGQTKVTVLAGAVAEGVDIVLAPQAVVEPYYESTSYEGFITCALGASVVVSEECGNGVGTPVGTFGKNDRNNIDWLNNVTTLDGLTSIYYELTWNPNSAAAQQLGLHVAHNMVCLPACEAEKTYCNVFENYGPPVQVCELRAEDIGIEDPATDLPWSIVTRAWVSPSDDGQVPNVLLEQAFVMYRTDFYNMDRPEGFTAVPVT